MSVELHFNQQTSRVTPGASLFDCAEALGIKVPTSCRKQGKCKECLVEVAAGMDCLSARVPEESHLKQNFRLSCRCQIIADTGVVRCHTMRRGDMRIERHALQLPTTHQKLKLDPAVTRDGDRILAGRRGDCALDRADSRAGDGFGHDDGGHAAVESGNRRSGRRRVV